MNLDPLGVIFMAKDMASATIEKLEHNFQGLDKTVQATAKNFGQGVMVMGQGLAVLGAGAAVLAPLGIGLHHAVIFQSELVKLGNIAGITGDELAKMGNDVRMMSAEFDFSPTEVIKGMQELASAGFAAKEAFDIAPSVLLFERASGGLLNMESSASTVVAAMRGYGFEVEQAGMVTDMLTAATNTTSLKFDELGLMLGNTAADANLANQSFANTLAMLGALRDTGLTSLRASEKLRESLKTMISPKAEEAANALGVALRGTDGKLRQVVDIIGDLQPKLEGLGQRQKEAALAAIFGHQSMAVYNAVVKSTFSTIENGIPVVKRGTDSLRTMSEGIANSAGMTKRQFEAVKGTALGAFKAMKENIEDFLIALGTPMLEGFTKIVVGIQKLTHAIAIFANEHPKMMKFIAAVLGFVGAFLVAVGAVIFFKGAILALGGLLAMVGITIGSLVAIFVQAALVIGALALASYVLYKAFQANFGGIADYANLAWQKISMFFRSIYELVANGEISEELNAQLDAIGVGRFVDMFMRVFSRAKEFLGGVFDGLVAGLSIAEPALRMMFGALGLVVEQVGVLVGVWMSGFDVITGGIDGGSTALEKFAFMGRLVGMVIGGVVGVFASGFATIASGVLMLIDFLVMVKIGVDALLLSLINLGSYISSGLVSGLQAIGSFVGLSVGEEGAAATAAGGGPGLNVPTVGLGNAALSTEASVAATKGTTEAVKGGNTAGPGNQTITTQVVLDGRVVAESVNNVNESSRLRKGGVR